MANEAANIVDRILPSVPVRQWVLSLPFELRGLAAQKPDVLTALGRIFTDEVLALYRRGAKGRADSGAVSHVQRFGGSLNVHVHWHAVFLDGVFVDDGGALRFVAAPAPEKADVERLVSRIRDRALRWLRRKRYLDERPAEDRSNEAPEPTAIEACLQLALAGGAFLKRPVAPAGGAPDDDLDRKDRRFSAHVDGFDLHCAVRMEADDDEGRERLLRYCARPPFALDRIERLPDGRVAYRVKTPRRGASPRCPVQLRWPDRGVPHRVMSPVDLLARLAAILPPPRHPLTRYAGVLAPGSRWRKRVVPRPPKRAPRCEAGSSASLVDSPSAEPPPASHPSSDGPRGTSVGAGVVLAAAPVADIGPTVITVKHWGRLLDGELLATSPRVEWSKLLRRTFAFDVMVCPACRGRMRVLAAIVDEAVARKILDHLGARRARAARAPPLPPAAGPPETPQTRLALAGE